jgi:peptidoglycan hydrolase-like protein with peptidoglycan-binding domain
MTNWLLTSIKGGSFMKRIMLLVFMLSIGNSIFCQDFSRIIEVRTPRMNGPDIRKIQTILTNYGFNEVGEIDGYYGPLLEAVINKIQYYAGFEQNGKVNKVMWDFLFNVSNEAILKNISIISKYNVNLLKKESEQNIDGIRSTEGNLVNRYYQQNDLKIGEIFIAGETGKVEYNFYYISTNYCIVVEKRTNYPFPFYYLFTSEDEEYSENNFEKGTVIKYNSYIKNGNLLFQITDGNLLMSTNANLGELLNIMVQK